jgi:hypothetical protein
LAQSDRPIWQSATAESDPQSVVHILSGERLILTTAADFLVHKLPCVGWQNRFTGDNGDYDRRDSRDFRVEIRTSLANQGFTAYNFNY